MLSAAVIFCNGLREEANLFIGGLAGHIPVIHRQGTTRKASLHSPHGQTILYHSWDQ